MREPELFEALEQGATVLTATRRLAGELRRRFDRRQIEQGREAWPSADVLAFGDWARRCWEWALEGPWASGTPDAAPAPTLLSERQALLLWERMVAASPGTEGLLHRSGAARDARDAWRLLKAWRVPEPEAGSAEVEAFRQWSTAYTRLLAARGWLDEAELPDRLAEGLRTGWLEAPSRVVLAGFDDLTPQQRALPEALRARDVPVEALEPEPPGKLAARRVALPDAEAEICAAARWTRHWLEQPDPGRIGVVVPALSELRPAVERIFADVLVPGAALPGQSGGGRPFNVSGGVPLADVPIVADALALLALTPQPAPLEALGVLLHSPFLAGAEAERSARGLLDVRLRSRGGATLSPRALARAARPSPEGGTLPWRCPALAAALDRWAAFQRQQPRKQTPGAWAQSFAGLLSALGWPGERPRSSAEQQALGKWNELLAELGCLELVAPVMGRAEALAWLRRLAGETLFQPQSAETAVQVLGVLESGGLTFDHLWVLGLHDERWPAAPRPNPFLPLALQRRLGMPRASMARELEIARRETARLLAAAPDVVVSHPRLEGERELRPSPLIQPVAQAAPEGLPASGAPTLLEALAGSATLEALPDFRAPPVAEAHVSGGTALFQDQAACPFRAFARHRLHARAPEQPEPGLTPPERGTVVHKAMEAVWRRLERHAALAALDDTALAALLDEAAAEALAALQGERPEPLGARFLALEHERLVGVLEALMAEERARAPFEVVGREQAQIFQIGGVEVSGRIDRIDRVADGRHVILDYKTSREVRVGSWKGDRPDEPQLPLYCASGTYPVAGVAFVQLRRGSTGYVGLADDPALFPNAKPFDAIAEPTAGAPHASGEALVAHWRTVLEALAAEFRAGEARVAPKDGRSRTCTLCDLASLCRIDELLDWGAAAPEEDDG